MKYIKKPVVIDAIKWEGSKASWDMIHANFPDIKIEPGEIGSMSFFIETLEGGHICSKGDYVIRGVEGEYYPCKPDIFKKTYDEVI
jgi:hypothetical protein